MRKLVAFLLAGSAWAQMIGSHKAVYDPSGRLLPWTSWEDAIDREMAWYLRCLIEHGYPRFVWMTFMDGSYNPIERRRDFIPAMQNGMGIISYLRYDHYKRRKDARVLEFARSMGDYPVKEALTPDEGAYPRFPRSTGLRARFPQPPDCGSQADQPYEIQPDKGGIAAYSLAALYKETREKRYLDQALHTARVLVRNMRPGDAKRSPWPFRVDWRDHARRLIEFCNRRFTSVRWGVAVCGEQDYDHNPWGGILSTWGSVLVLYTSATGSPEYRLAGEQALTLCLYAVDEDGRVRDSLNKDVPGGWQEDAHTDKIHNVVDALTALKK